MLIQQFKENYGRVCKFPIKVYIGSTHKMILHYLPKCKQLKYRIFIFIKHVRKCGRNLAYSKNVYTHGYKKRCNEPSYQTFDFEILQLEQYSTVFLFKHKHL